jgi:transposase
MRPYGTSEQLKKRRKEALKLLKRCVSVEAVATQAGVDPQSVRRWRREQNHPKEKSERPPGRSAYLTKEQIQKLEKELLRGAYAHGYSEDYWTLDRIGHVIWTLFGVRYEQSGVWHLLTRMGWSSQKVQRLAIQRDDKAIANWKRRVWPRIKKVA